VEPLVHIVDVALNTCRCGVLAGQRESGQRVIETSHPVDGARRMTCHTVGPESRCLMRRLRCTRVVCRVTGIAIRRQTLEHIVLVALETGHRRM
jgi:hypothetical protein